MRTRLITTAAALLCIGIGVGWLIHPGAGIASVGGLVWADLILDSLEKRKRR